MKQFYTLLFCLFIIIALYAQPGSLDKSFGQNGKTLSPFSFGCNALAIQADGKIIAGGGGGAIKNDDTLRYLLTRYNIDGNIDINFGDSGRAVLGSNLGIVYPLDIAALAIQPDDKIVAAGRIGNLYQQTDILVVRFNKDGSIDKSLGDEGITRIDLGLSESATGLALQSDGRILVSGIKTDNLGGFVSTFTLRFLPDGKLDNIFGDKGKIVTTGFGLFAKVHGLGIYQDKIMIGIMEWINEVPQPIKSYVVLKYLQSGQIDSSYGINGIARLTFPKEDDKNVDLNNISVLHDGKVLVCGSIGKDTPRLAVARFTEKGFPDSSFGINGYASLIQPNTFSGAYNVFMQADNKIIAGGYYYNKGNSFGAVRFLNNGSIDSSYGDNGIAATSILGEEPDAASCAFLQPDGKMLVGGNIYPDNIVLQGLVRFTGDIGKKQIIITKIKKWLQHRNGIIWDNTNVIKNYAVQRSGDGVKWTTVNRPQTTAHSQSSVNYYEDATPLSGNNFYRLQTTSVNGTVNYSNVIAVTANEDAIKISPNPAKNVLQIQGLPAGMHSLSSSNNLPGGGQAKLTVVDFTGNAKLQAVVNNTVYNLNIASLKTGNYLLKIETNNNLITKKFVKE